MNREKKVKRFKLNRLYPQLIRQIDDRLLEFLSIKVYNADAKEKLQASLLYRNISRYSMSIEKVISKKMDNFL